MGVIVSRLPFMSRDVKGITYGEIKLCLTNIATGIGSLHNHLLASQRGGCEGELIAGAAARAGTTDGCEAVGQVIAHGPW